MQTQSTVNKYLRHGNANMILPIVIVLSIVSIIVFVLSFYSESLKRVPLMSHLANDVMLKLESSKDMQPEMAMKMVFSENAEKYKLLENGSVAVNPYRENWDRYKLIWRDGSESSNYPLVIWVDPNTDSQCGCGIVLYANGNHESYSSAVSIAKIKEKNKTVWK